MPIYEFKCNACSCTFEELIRNQTQVQELACPKCHSANLNKLISMFGFSGDVEKGVSSSSNISSCNTCTSKNCSSCH